MDPYGLASEGGGPLEKKTDADGNEVDWEIGDEWYDWNGEGDLDRYKIRKKDDRSLCSSKTESYYKYENEKGNEAGNTQ